MDILILQDPALPECLVERRDLVVVMPYIDEAAARRACTQLARRAACDGLLVAVEDRERKGYVHTANRIFRATRSELFGYVAQDAYAGRNWGRQVQDAFAKESRALLGFNDGKWQGLLAAFGVARRSWAVKNYEGDLFYPEYFGHYADVELTLLAMQAGVYAYDPNCFMVEVDYEKEDKYTNPVDKALYLERKMDSFNNKVLLKNLINLFQ